MEPSLDTVSYALAGRPSAALMPCGVWQLRQLPLLAAGSVSLLVLGHISLGVLALVSVVPGQDILKVGNLGFV